MGRTAVLANGHDARAKTSGAAASLVVKASGGVFVSGAAYSAADTYLQIHDSVSLPADTAVPVMVVKIVADTTVSLDFLGGLRFSTGIVLATSSTATTLTTSGTALMVATYR